MTLPAGGRAEYADAVVYLKTPSGTVRVRRAPGSWTTGEFPGPPGQAVHVITAHNPGGAGREQAANAAAQASLEAELTRRELQWWPAAGGDPAWVHVEPSAAVIGLNRGQALELGRQYGQDAVFELTPGSRLIVSCHDGTVTSTGWSIDALDDGHPESDRAAERPSSGPSASDASPDRAAPGQQPHQQEAPSSPYPPDWLAPGGFLAALGHREGTLMSLTADGQTLMIRGHGDGLVTLGGPGDDPAEPCTIAEVMGLLAERGTFDPDPGGDWRYASGGWDAGEVAAVIAPWHDLNGGGATEFAVDGIEMRTDGYGLADPAHPPEAETLTLATFRWEPDDGGGSPGNDDSGDVVLLRVGPRYVIYQCSGGDTIADTLTAASDDEAIALFHDSNLPPPQ